METADPRAALADGDVTTRSAAARDLALTGTLEDLQVLVDRARSDKSSAVRLYAAAAAADIVSRYRRGGLPAEIRESIEEWVGRADPATNPSLLMLLAPFPERGVVQRLLRMMRDPRNEVRAGAAVALRRLALAAEALELPVLEALAADTLKRKLTPDAVFELVRLAGEVGWTHIDDLMRKAATQSEQLREAVDEAFARNRKREDLASLDGYWVDHGLDVQEAGSPEPRGFLAVTAGEATTDAGPQTLSLEDGRLSLGGAPARLLFAAPPGLFHERVAVIQTAERTYWRQQGAALVDLLDSGAELPAAAFASMAGDLEELEGAAGQRARLIASWGSGDLEAAKEAIDGLTDKKKPRTDLWYWKGRIYADLGDAKTAKASLDQFLDKAKKNHPLRAAGDKARAALG
ncbi:MAG: hypothetical protein EP330_25420 [Deltaproteobacteria bacterium]|nr:MAG: hypothetical protein EP330_25420 [Deltaproteobacteria bacterium]